MGRWQIEKILLVLVMQEIWAGGRLRKFLILGYAGDVGRWQIKKILLVLVMQELWAGGRLRKFLILGYAGDMGRWQIEKILNSWLCRRCGQVAD